MVGQSRPTDSFTVPSGFRVLSVRADTGEYGNIRLLALCEDKTHHVLMDLDYLHKSNGCASVMSHLMLKGLRGCHIIVQEATGK